MDFIAAATKDHHIEIPSWDEIKSWLVEMRDEISVNLNVFGGSLIAFGIVESLFNPAIGSAAKIGGKIMLTISAGIGITEIMESQNQTIYMSEDERLSLLNKGAMNLLGSILPVLPYLNLGSTDGMSNNQGIIVNADGTMNIVGVGQLSNESAIEVVGSLATEQAGIFVAEAAMGNGNNSYDDSNDFFEDIDKIVTMAKEEIYSNLPEGWTFYENKGFIHIRDSARKMRIRIDPPDKNTPYTHIHFFDVEGNPLDINGNVVDHRSPNAHIPYRGGN